MGELDIYESLGFKFFLCRADKTPDIDGGSYDENGRWKGDSWKDEKYHITKEQAEKHQKLGRMIGAWIPEDVIIVDIDRHKEVEEDEEIIKIDGAKAFKEFEKKYNYDFMKNATFTVKTGGGGRHLFYLVDKGHNFKQTKLKKKNEETNKNESIGIDTKTNKGYVIAAGSPGYEILFDDEYEPIELPIEIEQFILDHSNYTENKKNCEYIPPNIKRKHLPVKNLKSILKKIDAANFRDNGRWIEFVMSIKAICGDDEDVREAIIEWSSTDPAYDGKERTTLTRIDSTEENGNITAGTFVHYLREENVSQYLITQIVKLNSISNILLDSEASEITIPFEEPDYRELANIPSAREFFETQGNTSGAAILEIALQDKVLYCENERKSYYFDGNRFIQLNDFYGVVYTIIYRVIKILYNNEEPSKENNDLLYKCVRELNRSNWKIMTWKEVCSKPLVYREYVDWDSPKIKETITTIDGVIDFTTGVCNTRLGYFEEYRKSYFSYSNDEILNAGKPEKFLKFFDYLFTEPSTAETAKYCISLNISGNSGKRLFQMWEGSGSNGKSTLLETLKHVIGPDKTYAGFSSELLLEGTKRENYKSELVKFQGKYFCFTTEAPKGSRLSQNRIKALTGGDTLQGKALFQMPIEFDATWQIIYAVNDLPYFHGDDPAFINRLMVIPFNRIFYKDEEDKKRWIKRGAKSKQLHKANDTQNFKQSLYSEKAQILKWMIDTYNYMNNKLNGIIPESPECQLKKNIYVKDNDDTGIFLEHFCFIDEDKKEDCFIVIDDIVNEYREFTGQLKKGERKIVDDIMKHHGVIEKEVRRVDIWEGAQQVRKQKTILVNIRMKNENEIDRYETEKLKKEKKELKEITDEELGNLL